MTIHRIKHYWKQYKLYNMTLRLKVCFYQGSNVKGHLYTLCADKCFIETTQLASTLSCDNLD